MASCILPVRDLEQLEVAKAAWFANLQTNLDLELANPNTDEDYCNSRYSKAAERANDLFQKAEIKLSSVQSYGTLHFLSPDIPFNEAEIEIPLCYMEYEAVSGLRVFRIFTSGARFGEFTGAKGQAYKPKGPGDIVYHDEDIKKERDVEMEHAMIDVHGDGGLALMKRWKRQDQLIKEQKKRLNDEIDNVLRRVLEDLKNGSGGLEVGEWHTTKLSDPEFYGPEFYVEGVSA